MMKPKLCLALSLSLTAVQANTIGAQAIPTNNNEGTANNLSSSVGSSTSTQGHSLFLLSSKGTKSSASGAPVNAPAAVLTIHPLIEAASGKLLARQPKVADGHGKKILAQLAPDLLLSQGNPDYAGASVIPPVVTGVVDFEELKTSNVIELKVSQSRTFKLKNKIVRVSISDPSIAEPILIAENELVLLGHNPGGATLVLWDDAGNSAAIDLRVMHDFSQLQSALREIDPRIIVKPIYGNGDHDRIILLGDVDHPESIIRAFGTANVFMGDSGMQIEVANSRLIKSRIGELSAQGGGGAGGGSTGQLSQLNNVDKYTFFPNLPNNISKAQVVSSEMGRVTSLIKVRKVPMIVLHCTFMEMSSVAARELGAQLGLTYSGDNFNFGLGGNNLNNGSGGSYIVNGITPYFNQGVSGAGTPQIVGPVSFVSNAVVQSAQTNGILTGGNLSGVGQAVLNQSPGALLGQSVLLGAPGGANFGTSNLQNIFTSLSNIHAGASGIFSLNPTIQGIISRNRSRVLAEPTLVTISGERASFLAGGEIPVIESVASAGTTGQSVTFEPFGLRLNIIPVLMENGNINLEVSPEERLISSVIAFQPSSLSSSIPGFTTRRAQTIVEMKPGQELFIAGLISTNSGRDIIKTPILGEVPVLGALYRSKSFTKNESELVVAIRPEIILPGSPGQLKLPEELSRVEGPRDTNMFQVEPTVIDERYYTTGRAERYQKTSPTLPEGSPIPENE